MRITKGLVIADPWIGYILDGTKDWEMRSSATFHRGWFALIRKGTGAIYGVAKLVDSSTPLSPAEMIVSFGHHRIPEHMIRSGEVAKWNTPWKLSDVRRFDQPIDPFSEREVSIREALIRAVHSVHVPRQSVPDAHLDAIAAELSAYASIYSTNYDLTLYWALMRNQNAFRDYFWSEKFDVTNTEIWSKRTKVHFLHGGLHLYRRPNGHTLKRPAAAGQNLLDLFGTAYQDSMPLFISEGTAQEKLASIYRSDYLSFVFARLAQDTEPLVLFGHSLGDSDKHLIGAIGNHQGRSVAVSLRAAGNIRQKRAALIEALPEAALHFYDAATHPLGATALTIEEPAQ